MKECDLMFVDCKNLQDFNVILSQHSDRVALRLPKNPKGLVVSGFNCSEISLDASLCTKLKYM